MNKVDIYHIEAETPIHKYSLCGVKTFNIIGNHDIETINGIAKSFNGFAKICKKCMRIKKGYKEYKKGNK